MRGSYADRAWCVFGELCLRLVKIGTASGGRRGAGETDSRSDGPDDHDVGGGCIHILPGGRQLDAGPGTVITVADGDLLGFGTKSSKARLCRCVTHLVARQGRGPSSCGTEMPHHARNVQGRPASAARGGARSPIAWSLLSTALSTAASPRPRLPDRSCWLRRGFYSTADSLADQIDLLCHAMSPNGSHKIWLRGGQGLEYVGGRNLAFVCARK